MEVPPNVQIFWNFWPFEWFFWWPVKVVLNFFSFPAYILSLAFIELWNFVPDIFGMLLWVWIVFLGLPLTFVGIFLCFLYLTAMTYFYVTALPEIVIIGFIAVIGGSIAGLLYALTEYVFDWATMPSTAWLKVFYNWIVSIYAGPITG